MCPRHSHTAVRVYVPRCHLTHVWHHRYVVGAPTCTWWTVLGLWCTWCKRSRVDNTAATRDTTRGAKHDEAPHTGSVPTPTLTRPTRRTPPTVDAVAVTVTVTYKVKVAEGGAGLCVHTGQVTADGRPDVQWTTPPPQPRTSATWPHGGACEDARAEEGTVGGVDGEREPVC